MIVIATYISIVIGMSSLAWAFSQPGFDSFARWAMFFGVIWLFARWQRWWWFSALGLILTVILAAVGVWYEVAPGWMLASGVFTLIAWDLTDFAQRTQFEPVTQELREMGRRHIGRVTLLALEGLVLSSLIMWMRSELSIEWLELVAIVFFLGLLQLVLWLSDRRRRG